MKKRPNFEEIYMSLAESLAKRSTCQRLNVGTVVTTTDFRKVLSVGYNGNAQGLTNCCDSEEPGKCGCIHSETNAIINCDTPRNIDKYIFVTHTPCIMCSKQIINLGNVKKVFYKNDYRDKSGQKLLNLVGIKTKKL